MWYTYAIGTAFFESLKDVAAKRGVVRFDPYAVAWAQRIYCAAVLVPLGIAFGERRWPAPDFWWAVAIAIVMMTVTSVLYMRALERTDLSLALPILSLSPILILITGPLINREMPTILGAIGVALAATGAYVVNLNRRTGGWLAPFSAIWRDPGRRAMLIVTVLWGLNAPFDKIAVRASDPFTYAAVVNAATAVTLLPFLLRRCGLRDAVSAGAFRVLAPVGVLQAISFVLQMIALSLAPVPYVISVKRGSTLFGMFWGKVVFRERHVGLRASGALIILAGTILILLAGSSPP